MSFLRKLQEYIYSTENFTALGTFPFGVAFLRFFVEMFQKFVSAFRAGNFFVCPKLFEKSNLFVAGFEIHKIPLSKNRLSVKNRFQKVLAFIAQLQRKKRHIFLQKVEEDFIPFPFRN